MPTTIVLYRFPHPEFARAVLRGSRRFEVRIATRASQLAGADLVMIEDTRDAAGDIGDHRLVRCSDPTSGRAILAAVDGIVVEASPAPAPRAVRAVQPHADQPSTVERRYKGEVYYLDFLTVGDRPAYRVRGGSIDTTVHGSPSGAAKWITGSAINGWRFWGIARA